jgi:hypothetical protein
MPLVVLSEGLRGIKGELVRVVLQLSQPLVFPGLYQVEAGIFCEDP